jgi:SWI/SNF-related matrix-associated actin-dependent regulator of chromatin subfamily D
VVEFENNECKTIEWNNTSSDSGCNIDKINIKRKLPTAKSGQPPINSQNLKIKLYFESNPRKFKLQTDLAEILGIQEDTRVNIVGALWQYIKSNRLQESENRDIVNCNAELMELFELEKISFHEIVDQLKNFLEEADPLEIEYTI